jgi:hypothetical protein
MRSAAASIPIATPDRARVAGAARGRPGRLRRFGPCPISDRFPTVACPISASPGASRRPRFAPRRPAEPCFIHENFYSDIASTRCRKIDRPPARFPTTDLRAMPRSRSLARRILSIARASPSTLRPPPSRNPSRPTFRFSMIRQHRRGRARRTGSRRQGLVNLDAVLRGEVRWWESVRPQKGERARRVRGQDLGHTWQESGTGIGQGSGAARIRAGAGA